MPTPGFHEEWITIGWHRILLRKRCGCPDATMRFIAEVAVRALHTGHLTPIGAHYGQTSMRVVALDFDDKNDDYLIRIAYPFNPEKKEDDAEESGESAARRLEYAIRGIFVLDNYRVEAVKVVLSSADKSNDHFNLMEHLSVGAGVAESRFPQSADGVALPPRTPTKKSSS